ncbi:S1 family peptidase [Haloarcula halophila]|uniref:S1 family peptidase n=1 Tax=Haloarcula TaxID=2237 RepID=UPI0023E4607F|nr:serine protease [Halomicroarcula sp. DFY41]
MGHKRSNRIPEIRAATCRVDVANKKLGTAFWIGDRYLLTANHVVTAIHRDKFTIVTEGDSDVVVQVTEQDQGSDLAVLEADERPDDVESLSLSPEIPIIGTEVVWSGYARLIGESKIDRQRFGWGPVASGSFDDGGGHFFEVDGLFNSGHSGGPVIEQETGQVVGVVSASAGNFEQQLERWDDQIHRLENLFHVTSEISGSHKNGFLVYDTVEDAVYEKDILEGYGLDVELSQREDDVLLRFDLQEASILVSKIQAEMARTLLDTVMNTFQMGIGVASGGQGMMDIIRQYI